MEEKFAKQLEARDKLKDTLFHLYICEKAENEHYERNLRDEKNLTPLTWVQWFELKKRHFELQQEVTELYSEYLSPS